MPENIRVFAMSLSMDNPEQRAAWKLLQGLPKGSRTDYVCRRLTEREHSEELAAIVYASAMKALDEYGGMITKPDPNRQIAAGNVDDDILGFLSALQNEGDDE